jgi:hypothetical protein
MLYEAIRYDKININRRGEGAVLLGTCDTLKAQKHQRIDTSAVMQVVFTFKLQGPNTW